MSSTATSSQPSRGHVMATSPAHESYLQAVQKMITVPQCIGASLHSFKPLAMVGRFVIEESDVWTKMTTKEQARKFATNECQFIVVEAVQESHDHDQYIQLNLSCYSFNQRVWTRAPEVKHQGYGPSSFKNWYVTQRSLDIDLFDSFPPEYFRSPNIDPNSIVIQTHGESYTICFHKPNQDSLKDFIDAINSPHTFFQADHVKSSMIEFNLTRMVKREEVDDLQRRITANVAASSIDKPVINWQQKTHQSFKPSKKQKGHHKDQV